jgi:hypothetical protein
VQHLKNSTLGSVPVLDQLAKAKITHDREWLIVKDNNFHYLGFNGFCLLSCLTEMFLLFEMTA